MTPGPSYHLGVVLRHIAPAIGALGDCAEPEDIARRLLSEEIRIKYWFRTDDDDQWVPESAIVIATEHAPGAPEDDQGREIVRLPWHECGLEVADIQHIARTREDLPPRPRSLDDDALEAMFDL